MRANSPSAIFASVSLHGLVLAVLLFLSLLLARQSDPPAVIFELVAGPPTAIDATEAPRGGSALQVNVPKVVLPPDPVVQAEPVAPTPPKVEPKPVEKPVPVKETPKPAPKEVAKPKPEPPKTLSYEEFVKQHGKPTPKTPAQTTPRPVRTPPIDVKGIVGGVKNGSTANTKGGGGGTAMTRPDQSLIDNYIAQLRRALQLAHEKPAGLSDRLEVSVAFDIAANGDISNARIARSSGDREFDRSVIEAFRRYRSIGPTPDGRSYSWTIRFRSRDD